VIESDVKRPLGDELLFGKLEFGGHVLVDVKDGAVTFEYTSNEPEPSREPSREAVS
jgi:ATP-dependent Clp protease ATP-binding subunit ClpA